MTALLETRGLSRSFRGLKANSDIDFVLKKGEIRCVIGPNGAGKTTFLSMISGHLRPSSGQIFHLGQDVTDISVVGRARLGIARKFQTPSVFHNLSSYENIELAAFRTGRKGPELSKDIHQVLELVRLSDHRDTPVQFLSHGQRQWLEIGMLVAMKARLLLLDEPAAGMTADEAAATTALIKTLVQDGETSVVVIEHNMDFIRMLSTSITVLNLGCVLAEGTFEEIAANPQVVDIYLGKQL